MKKQLHVFYSGRVQGVGFRFTAEDVALGLEVTGWVKNLPDSRVEVVAEADEKILQQYLEQVRNSFLKKYITKEDVSWSEATGKYSDFQIRF
jgi:acylphosphatase